MINARNVVVFDNEGIPSIMVRFDKCTNADLLKGGSNQTHPAFIINGKEVDRIYIAKYPCTLINGKPYSLPFTKPATNISLDEAAKACFSKGEGWHLLTAAEYALVALESEKNGTPPRGNTNFGASHSNPEEKGLCCDGGYKTAAGSGPCTWAHDHTPYGVYDLCGNVWEWVSGLWTDALRLSRTTTPRILLTLERQAPCGNPCFAAANPRALMWAAVI